jgi:serine/threonine-protein kinase
MIGTQLAHYKITGHIGTGGMGEVYQATDSKLGRSVAIKLLPEEFTHDPDRSARFEREARVLASLNHPNIAAIYGIEESGRRKFSVMELVGGETLEQKIKRGEVPIDVALDIMKEIAHGLEAAHERGIIHRDLKPANVKITPGGKVKILDFGLAKAYESETANANLSNSPTLSLAATQAGLILGTAAYMSPEQARGKTVDKRTDIWAFGVVFYEMLTGSRPFHGEDVSEILASVLKDEPQWESVTPQVWRLLRKCLAKDPAGRLRDIGDAMALLDEASRSDRQVASVKRKSKLPWILAVVATSAALILGYISYQGAAGEHLQEARLTLLASDKTELTPNTVLAISADGRRVAFVANTAGDNPRFLLWVRDLNSLDSKPLVGTDGARLPFWSPDGKNIGYFANGKLWRIDTEGAPPIELADAPTGIAVALRLGAFSKSFFPECRTEHRCLTLGFNSIHRSADLTLKFPRQSLRVSWAP